MRKIDRNEKVAALFKTGKTMQEVGSVFGLSRERVRQILSEMGLKSDQGGIRLRAMNRKMVEKEKRDNSWLPVYKCTLKQAREISGSQYLSKGLCLKYLRHKTNAKRRGIQFCLTFPEWAKVWIDSGEVANIGLTASKYVMARKGDIGPYSVENVEIVTSSRNHLDAWKNGRFINKLRKRLDKSEFICNN